MNPWFMLSLAHDLLVPEGDINALGPGLTARAATRGDVPDESAKGCGHR